MCSSALCLHSHYVLLILDVLARRPDAALAALLGGDGAARESQRNEDGEEFVEIREEYESEDDEKRPASKPLQRTTAQPPPASKAKTAASPFADMGDMWAKIDELERLELQAKQQELVQQPSSSQVASSHPQLQQQSLPIPTSARSQHQQQQAKPASAGPDQAFERFWDGLGEHVAATEKPAPRAAAQPVQTGSVKRPLRRSGKNPQHESVEGSAHVPSHRTELAAAAAAAPATIEPSQIRSPADIFAHMAAVRAAAAGGGQQAKAPSQPTESKGVRFASQLEERNVYEREAPAVPSVPARVIERDVVESGPLLKKAPAPSPAAASSSTDTAFTGVIRERSAPQPALNNDAIAAQAQAQRKKISQFRSQRQ